MLPHLVKHKRKLKDDYYTNKYLIYMMDQNTFALTSIGSFAIYCGYIFDVEFIYGAKC